MPNEMFKLEQVGDVTVATFIMSSVYAKTDVEEQAVRKEILDLANMQNRAKILLNFKNVSFFSSIALEALIGLHKRLNERGGKLVLCSISPTVRELLIITRLVGLFAIKGSREEGLAAFSA